MTPAPTFEERLYKLMSLGTVTLHNGNVLNGVSGWICSLMLESEQSHLKIHVTSVRHSYALQALVECQDLVDKHLKDIN